MSASASASRVDLARWLIRQTRGLLGPLALSTASRVVGRLLGASVLVLAAAALVRIATGFGYGFEPLRPQPDFVWVGGDASGPAPSAPVVGIDLVPLVVAIVALSLAKAGLRYLEHYSGHWVAFTALQRLRELLFARLVPQAPAATSGRASAELTERATRDIDRIEVFFAHTIPPVVASVVVPLVALSWLATAVDPGLAGILAVFMAVALVAPFVFARSSWAASRGELEARGRVATHVADDLQGIREVLAFEAEGRRLVSLDALHDEASGAQRRVARSIALRQAVDRALWGGALLALLLAGRPADQVVLAVAVLFGLWLANAGADDFAAGLDAAFAACERVRSVCEAAPAVADRGSSTLEGAGGVAVELDRVSFSYGQDAGVALSDVSARFEPGRWHYVAGASGSGKSTLAALLIRAWDRASGRILLEGAPIEELSLDALRRVVAVVDQRPVLFPGTVASNLRLGRPEAPETDLAEALRIVDLDGAGATLAEGLDTVVGERGSGLSGGQVQRLAIARALVAGPRVLVLDEALSQLDADTATTVRERLAALPSAPTIIEITHRVDIVPDDADVLVVDRGRLVEHGTAGELRTRGGAFERLLARG